MIEIIGTELYQWDVGRSVKVTGASHVHLANQGDSRAVIMELADSQALIPNYLLQTGKQLCVYAVSNGVTIERKTLSVKKRERPANYVYEDDQRNYIYELITNAEDAVASANQATENARQASAGATAATLSANTAANNATAAADSANKAATQAAHTAKSLMVVGEAKGEVIALNDAIDQFLVGCRIFGKTTQDGTPTPDAPVELVSVGESGSIGVTVSGKNIAGVIRTNSLTTRYGSLVTIKPIGLSKGVSYVVSFDTENTGISCYINPASFAYKAFQMDGTRKTFVFTYTEDKTMDAGADGSVILVSRDSETSNVASGLISNVQIEVANAATTYEPYKAQTLTISTPNGLPGIPVTSDGNYTDENGQQWVCDEIDFARGVYVQRIGKVVLNSQNSYVHVSTHGDAVRFDVRNIKAYPSSDMAFCTHLPVGVIGTNNAEVCSIHGVSGYPIIQILSSRLESVDASGLVKYLEVNPMTFYYVLATPTETPMPEEELIAYAALHTYKNHTTVSNDAGAWMELEYVMDAKKYIDRMIATGGGSIIPATVE